MEWKEYSMVTTASSLSQIPVLFAQNLVWEHTTVSEALWHSWITEIGLGKEILIFSTVSLSYLPLNCQTSVLGYIARTELSMILKYVNWIYRVCSDKDLKSLLRSSIEIYPYFVQSMFCRLYRLYFLQMCWWNYQVQE